MGEMSPTSTVKCDIAPCVKKESWQKKTFSSDNQAVISDSPSCIMCRNWAKNKFLYRKKLLFLSIAKMIYGVNFYWL